MAINTCKGLITVNDHVLSYFRKRKLILVYKAVIPGYAIRGELIGIWSAKKQ